MAGKDNLKDFKELTYSYHFSDSALTFLLALFVRQRSVVFKPDNTRLRVSVPAGALAHLNKHTTCQFDMLDVAIRFLTSFSLNHCRATQYKCTFHDSKLLYTAKTIYMRLTSEEDVVSWLTVMAWVLPVITGFSGATVRGKGKFIFINNFQSSLRYGFLKQLHAYTHCNWPYKYQHIQQKYHDSW